MARKAVKRKKTVKRKSTKAGKKAKKRTTGWFW